MVRVIKRRNIAADFDDFDCPKVPPTLMQALAFEMLSRVCTGANWLSGDGYAVAVLSPTHSWCKYLAEAMPLLVAEARNLDPETKIVTSLEKFDSEEPDYAYIEFVKYGKSELRTQGADVVAEVLSLGKTLVTFSMYEKQLPNNFLRSLDYTVVINPPDWMAFKKAIASHYGFSPTVTLSDSQCAKIEPDDLTLATRPNQTADEYVTRLGKLLGAPVESGEFDDVPTLESVYGMDEAVAWGKALAIDMAEYAAGRLAWRDVDKGALLVGRPGTGKTTYVQSLVRTLSQSCKTEVKLVSCSFAKWQKAGHLGDYLKSMNADFLLATESAPSVLFLDEMDSFGDRAKFAGDNSDYCRQTVNSLLEALDGTSRREGVIVVGASNDVNQIDPALLRPGRMDRVINIPLPNVEALQGIFRQHGGPELGDLTDIARLARGTTGAQVEQWCRAARRTARSERRAVTRDDLMSVVTAAVGPTRSVESLRVTAIHEAGHAYVIATEHSESLSFVSICGTGGRVVAGMTASKLDDRPIGIDELKSLLRQSLAGRAAEKVLLGRVTDGSGGGRQSDLGRATRFAALAVLTHGLVDETPRWYSGSDNDFTHVLVTRLDVSEQVDKLLAEAWQTTLAMIKSGRVAIRRIADELIKQETLQADTVLNIISASKKDTMKSSLYDSPDQHDQMYRC